MTGATPLPSGGCVAHQPGSASPVIPAIEDSVESAELAGDFLERYYDCRYLLDVREPGHDYRLLFHSNGLIVVTLAPSHPLLAPGVKVTSIDFQVTQQTNRLENTVQGKGKRGAQVVTANAPLFRAQLEDGRRFLVPACARGKLVQLNDRLRTDPSLLTKSDGVGGTFLAIILPKLGTSSGQKGGSLDSAEYARRRADVVRGGGDAGEGPVAAGSPAPAAAAAEDVASAESRGSGGNSPPADGPNTGSRETAAEVP